MDKIAYANQTWNHMGYHWIIWIHFLFVRSYVYSYKQYTAMLSYNIATSIMFNLSRLIVQSIPQHVYIYHITNLLG